ncbi:uncharacterized protein LOC107615691 [Arachis ipaensis]|uniref:uncharacterized protein LOC107615691 n=1 Tax=Arachis ipaensis TaxID=130454 RepID=UPI0007AF2812|nr:uncharacterized protein LOC107615691 [Arachis ipaensis]
MLTEECSAIIQHKLPQKLKDPGIFQIPCIIGEIIVEKALCDLGASINLMSLAMMKGMKIEEAKPMRMALQLADRSFKFPHRVVEDLFVKVGDFIFPADFVVLYMEEEAKASIILGRPFLATARAIIDVQNGKLILRLHDEKIVFNIFKAMSYPRESLGECMRLDAVEILVQEPFEESEEVSEEDPTSNSEVAAVQSVDELIPRTLEEKKEEKKAPKLELKALPPTLKYVYLGSDESYPVIINSALSQEQEKELIKVLQKHKDAIGWTLSNLKGISPSMYMHKILLEDDAKPSIQPQRRLNPVMKEVVQKEVMKLWQAGVIYPISDSPWVSPIQVVPKKGGITVVPNERNELIPTRTVIGWRMCIDYRKLNETTRKDHFPLPFMDQMLERLAGHAYYCFLEGYSGYNQIVVDPRDQEKTSFTCPYGVFAYRQCMLAFENLKRKLSSSPIIAPPNWDLPFEMMCDVSDFAIGVVLTQRKALKYLLAKQEPKPRLIKWVLLLQEFNIEIKDKKGVENKVADHLSRIPCEEGSTHNPSVNECFPDEQLMLVHKAPWFADIANFKATGEIEYLGGAYQRKKEGKSCGIAMVLVMEDTLEGKELQPKCCSVGSFGPLSSKMPKN